MSRYHWTNKSYAAKVPAETFGKWLEGLPNRNPETLVANAKSPRSPAHALFSWDDKDAAGEFRLIQARLLLGSFVIETVITATKNTKEHIVVAPFVTRAAPGQYEITTVAMRDDKKRAFMLSEALRQLRRLKRRYAALSELAVVFSALDAVEARQARKRS